MSLKHGLLGLLSYEPMTGYELNKYFKSSLGYFWQATYSQIYSELDGMEKKGWLVSERIIQNDKPNKRVYSTTEEGRAAFLDWLSSPDKDVKKVQSVKSAFLMRIFFAGEMSDEQTLDLLQWFRGECLKRSREYEGVREELKEDEETYDRKHLAYAELTLSYGEMLVEAGIAWAEKAIKTVENLDQN